MDTSNLLTTGSLSTDINGRNNTNNNNNNQQQRPLTSQVNYGPQQQTALFGLKPPTDDSPFYFAREQIPNQMKLLLETVVGVSVVLSLLLVYYSRIRRIQLTTSASRKFHLILCRIDRVWLYIFGNNLYSKIPITAWNPYNGIDGHTIFHPTEQWNRSVPERKTV